MAKNNYQLGLYEKSMPATLSWTEKLEYTKSAGFDSLEISIDETDEKLARLDFTDEQIFELNNTIRNTETPILSMCLSGQRKYPLGSTDENIQMQSLEILEKALIFAIKVGIRIIQIPGYDVYYEESTDLTKELFSKNLVKAVKLAAKYGVILGFETMEPEFMDSCTKALKHVNDVNSPYLGIYPDLGNVTNGCRKSGVSITEDIRNANGHIFAVHCKEIVEGKYREIPYGTGDTRFDEAMLELSKQNVMRYTAEFWYTGSQNWFDDLKFANTFLREKLDKYYK